MKTLLKILAALLLLAVVAGGAAIYFTRGAASTADAFFEAVRAERMGDAQRYLSEGFRAATDADALARYLDASQMHRVTATRWHSRSVSGGQARLEGTLTTESGGSVPIAIDLVKEQGAWKIHHISRGPAGLHAEPAVPDAPSTEAALALIQTTTRDFVTSLEAGDMTHFHGAISRLWRSQYSVADLEEAYRVFLDLRVDYGELNRLVPQLDAAPAVDGRGVLTLAGHFPTEPNRARFEYSYVREDGQWKPLGLHMRIGSGD
jgi:hypothetical protein